MYDCVRMCVMVVCVYVFYSLLMYVTVCTYMCYTIHICVRQLNGTFHKPTKRERCNVMAQAAGTGHQASILRFPLADSALVTGIHASRLSFILCNIKQALSILIYLTILLIYSSLYLLQATQVIICKLSPSAHRL